MVVEHSVPVLIIGGGPAGLIAASQIANHGFKCMIAERNLDTTIYPKMTLHNCRTMELMKRLGLDKGLRDVGVDNRHNFRSIWSTGLSEGGQTVGSWDYPSPNEWREAIRSCNDGTQPREPWQRCAQSVFEKWLKPLVQKSNLIVSSFGLKFDSLEEKEDCVVSNLEDSEGERHIVTSKYVIGCDGAGSRVRRNIGSVLIGGPTAAAYYLVNFRSTDMAKLRPEGQNWHIFFSSGGALIAQNEIDLWTCHSVIPLGTDIDTLDPYQAIYNCLGGSTGIPYELKIDEIVLTSSWRPGIAIVDKYRSNGGRVFLAGDSAHQNIPTGGYGYNTAVGDSIDIGWKISAVLGGYGGEHLLESYEIERRPVGVRNLEWSGIHAETHQKFATFAREAKPGLVVSKSAQGEKLRQQMTNHVHTQNIEQKCYGIEYGYRYNGSPVIVPDVDTVEPEWDAEHYVPSTWPGARAPHVWLNDGLTSIFDLFGRSFTLVDFTKSGKFLQAFDQVLEKLLIPIKKLHLPEEHHLRSIWERDAVLVRPDDMVAWRATADGDLPADVEEILLIAIGKRSSVSLSTAVDLQQKKTDFVQKEGFKGIIGNVDLAEVELQGDWQKAC